MPDEIDRATENAAFLLEARLTEHKHKKAGAGLKPAPAECMDCGNHIPDARKKVVPGCQRCIECQKAFEEGR